jgi:hypothetical protein
MEDATPPAPCRTRPHGRAEGIGQLLHRVSMPGGAALELAQAGSEGWRRALDQAAEVGMLPGRPRPARE